MSELGKAKTGGKRPPEPNELKGYDTGRLLALYRAACSKLAQAGGWRGAPLASEWARALSCELCERGHHAAVLAIEGDVRGASVPEPTRADGRRKRWEV